MIQRSSDDSEGEVPSSSSAPGVLLDQDSFNQWVNAANTTAQDLQAMMELWSKTRHAMDAATNDNLRALAFSVAQRNVALRLAESGMGAAAPAAVAAAVEQITPSLLNRREEPARGRTFSREDRGSRARRRSPQQASPPRESSYPVESMGKGSATDEEFQDDGLSSTLEQCTVSGDFDDDVDDGGGEPILTGFDLRAALGLEDPIELKRQLRWLHNLAARQEKVLDEMHEESERMLDNNHELALKVVEQGKELEEISRAYYLAIEGDGHTEKIMDGGERGVIDQGTDVQPETLALPDNNDRDLVRLAGGEEASGAYATKAPMMNGDAHGGYGGDEANEYLASEDPPVVPPLGWSEAPLRVPPAVPETVVGIDEAGNGQAPGFENRFERQDEGGRGDEGRYPSAAAPAPEALGDHHLGAPGTEGGVAPTLGMGLHMENGPCGGGMGAPVEQATETALEGIAIDNGLGGDGRGGNGSGGWPWASPRDDGAIGGVGGGPEGAAGTGGSGLGVGVPTEQAVEAPLGEGAPSALGVVGVEGRIPGADGDDAAAGSSDQGVGVEKSRVEQENGDHGAQASSTASTLPPPPMVLPLPGQPMSSLRRPPAYSANRSRVAGPLSNPFGGVSHLHRTSDKGTVNGGVAPLGVPNGEGGVDGSDGNLNGGSGLERSATEASSAGIDADIDAAGAEPAADVLKEAPMSGDHEPAPTEGAGAFPSVRGVAGGDAGVVGDDGRDGRGFGGEFSGGFDGGWGAETAAFGAGAPEEDYFDGGV